MLLLNTENGLVVKYDRAWYTLSSTSFDYWVRLDNAFEGLLEEIDRRGKVTEAPASETLLAPIGKQEVWAAGVTYFRSRTARMEESNAAGGSDFYDRVYHADRPELFMKATAHRVVGHQSIMRLRKDSKWIVPEPELTLLVNPNGKIIGYTVGNDLSCRDIEGENPLYLPQAKTFDACAAIGPGVWIAQEPLPESTKISIRILRNGSVVVDDATDLGQMKKKPEALVEYLYRESSFPDGCFLMTGTGIVPPDDFTLEPDDEIRISIDPIGTLINRVV